MLSVCGVHALIVCCVRVACPVHQCLLSLSQSHPLFVACQHRAVWYAAWQYDSNGKRATQWWHDAPARGAARRTPWHAWCRGPARLRGTAGCSRHAADVAGWATWTTGEGLRRWMRQQHSQQACWQSISLLMRRHRAKRQSSCLAGANRAPLSPLSTHICVVCCCVQAGMSGPPPPPAGLGAGPGSGGPRPPGSFGAAPRPMPMGPPSGGVPGGEGVEAVEWAIRQAAVAGLFGWARGWTERVQLEQQPSTAVSQQSSKYEDMD